MVNKQVYQVIDFARRLPHFLKLPLNDQRYLLKHSWNEVLILSVAYLSTSVSRALKFLSLRILIPISFPSLVHRKRPTTGGRHLRAAHTQAGTNVPRSKLHTRPQYGRASWSRANI